MIRDFRNVDLEPVLDIWLRASIQAHHFIAPEFWRSQLDAMREVYLPGAMSRVFEADGTVVGFCSVYADTLAALFVSPERQRDGIGTQLLADAMASQSTLQLTVYSANVPAIHFYEKQGFIALNEQLDAHTGHLEKVMRWVA
ncbi:N-acetyltransferase [Pseudomonas laurylsulfatiphila]|uniref:N-acetyltransferase n=1 Tax=Pseudomonas laurylsulfatiphila TaxID=2011015 RepID=A0A2S6FSG6_9PSED|nr:N-acetyltransferase [Pseudomonas laurylsulfatiphila]PPK40343.1 N-acetyltransferase [Pseudomonas laurylsulfatiphila]